MSCRKEEFIEKGVRPPLGEDPVLKNEPASIMPASITYMWNPRKMLTDLQKLLAHAVLINSVVYCALVFVAGLHTSNPAAWKLAIATLGLCWVCYAGEYLSGYGESYRRAAMVASGLSILTGLGAGLTLLVG